MRIHLLLFCCLLISSMLYAETSIWTRIEELSRHDTPQGNPQFEAYLKTLTRPQMLQAARECCEKAKTRVPQERWEEGVLPVGAALWFYGDENGGLTDDAMNQLLNLIASDNEEQLFRESLLGLLRQRYWPQLTTKQRAECRSLFLKVLLDKKAPVRLRTVNCRELEHAIAFEHRQIIYSDKNVRPLRNDSQKWRNLDDLVRKGEVKLDPDTRKSLKTVRDEIETITPTLSTLSNDANESPEVKDRAQKALKSLGELPNVSEK